jgi:predicted RNA binding protein YcfA (HicA-like mRNA interferase family)
MSKIEKLVKLLLSEPPEAKFQDIKFVLEYFNFIEVRSKGSHHIFRHEDGRMQVIPKVGGKKVKKVYIVQIIRLLQLR